MKWIYYSNYSSNTCATLYMLKSIVMLSDRTLHGVGPENWS